MTDNLSATPTGSDTARVEAAAEETTREPNRAVALLRSGAGRNGTGKRSGGAALRGDSRAATRAITRSGVSFCAQGWPIGQCTCVQGRQATGWCSTSCSAWSSGAKRRGSAPQQITMLGTRNAAATCETPVSFETSSRERWSSAAKVPVQPAIAPSMPSSAQVSQSSASKASPT